MWCVSYLLRLICKLKYLQRIKKVSVHCILLVKKERLKTVQRLLENLADVNLRDENGFTPLSVACNHGYKKIIQILLEETTKVNANT